MNITVNGSKISENFEEVSNLEDILVKISKKSLPQDHLVGNVLVNGKEFSELYPGQSQEIVIDNINDLEVTTVSLKTFAKAAVKDSIIFIGTLVESVNKTAELFRISDETVANEEYAKVLDTLRALLQFIDMAKNTVNWDFNASKYNGHTVQQEWEQLLELINGLSDIQEEGDWILLADMLEYEFVPALNRWKEIVEAKSIDL